MHSQWEVGIKKGHPGSKSRPKENKSKSLSVNVF